MGLLNGADAARVGGGADLGCPKIGDAGLGVLGVPDGAAVIFGVGPGRKLGDARLGAAERIDADGFGNSDLGGLDGLLGAEKEV